MIQIQLYNSLSKRKEIFDSLKVGEVSIYSCGPTVYDSVHIGNLRSFIMADTLQRMMRQVGGYKLRWVMNITDIDDKMIARAKEKYPDLDPKSALRKLADEYSEKFLADLNKVNVELDEVSAWPHATDYIEKMQTLIAKLFKSGVAYEAEGSIYFALDEYRKSGHKYGQLAQVTYATQSRIDDQDQKQGAGDFALWKAEKAGEPSWDFELDGKNYPGRPGWHIECSVMSTDLLGDEFDIHTGGIDLKFPHHENEIAQCGGKLARYWVHNEHLTVQNAKMAKSEGNFIRLEDIYDPIAFRLAILSAHYRSQMDYSMNILESAGRRLASLREWTSKIVNNPQAGTSPSIGDYIKSFNQAMADDMNTPLALSYLAQIENSQARTEDVYVFILHLDDVLGLKLLDNVKKVRDNPQVLDILDKRDEARRQKDYGASDSLRNQLDELGIGVEDNQDEQIVFERFNK
jgi:cysteinyl-tRNA synthetase